MSIVGSYPSDALVNQRQLQAVSLSGLKQPAAQTAERAEQPGFQYNNYQKKEASRQLADAWRGVADGEQAQKGDLPERQYVPRNPQDSVESRDMKGRYSGLNRALDESGAEARKRFAEMGDGSHTDPKNPKQQVDISHADGWVNVRYSKQKPDDTTSWQETRYRQNRPDQVEMKWDHGGSVSRKGTTVETRSDDGARQTYRKDGQGNLQADTVNEKGQRNVQTAMVDGSHRRWTPEGTKVTRPDPEMARYETVAARMGQVLNADGTTRELNEQERYIMAAGLRRFSPETLANLEQSGVHIAIADARNPPPGGLPGDEDGKWDSGTLAYYNRREKVLVFRQEDFQSGGANHINGTIRHEVGHAVDDMLNPDVGSSFRMHSDNDPRLLDLYDQYKARSEGNKDATWSEYGRSKPTEYYAEGMRKYLGGEDSRNTLKEKDPGLYDYVQETLQASRDRRLPYFQQAQAPAYAYGGPSIWKSQPAWSAPPCGQQDYWQQMALMMQMQQIQQMMQMQQMLLMVMMMSGMGGSGFGLGFGRGF